MKNNLWRKCFLLIPVWVSALEINPKLSLDYNFSAVYQHADFLHGIPDKGCGSLSTDIGINFHPTPKDEFQLTFSLAGGNGLKETFGEKGFSLAPNADDLEDDLKDINSSGRNYLLEAWYRKNFQIGPKSSLEFTVGIIDATAYIDTNEYANDEVTQFMNDVFVNNPLANLPSYDWGATVAGTVNGWTLRGLAITSKTEEGNRYNYYALQVESTLQTAKGPVNYRVYYYRTTKDFPNKYGSFDYLEGIGLSADWSNQKGIGLFTRMGLNTHPSTGDFKNLLSGGITLEGTLWGKRGHNLSLGIAYLKGNGDVTNVTVFEGFYSLSLNRYTTLTLDYQRDRERFSDKTREANVYGIRVNVSF
jgi:porin